MYPGLGDQSFYHIPDKYCDHFLAGCNRRIDSRCNECQAQAQLNVTCLSFGYPRSNVLDGAGGITLSIVIINGQLWLLVRLYLLYDAEAVSIPLLHSSLETL